MGNKLLRNYILRIAYIFSGTIISIITFPYVSRVLGADKLGQINLVQAYGYYFIHIASFGINSYAFREVSKNYEDKNYKEKIANEIFNINVIFSALSWLIYIVFYFVMPFRELLLLFFIYSFVILSDFLILEWLFLSYEDYLYITKRTIMVRIIVLILIFIVVKTEEDYILYLILITFSELGSRFFNLKYSQKYIKLKFRITNLNLNLHFKSLFILFIFRLINGISSNLDKIMLGVFGIYAQIGNYSVGIKIIFLLIPFIESIGTILFKKINNLLLTEDKENFIKILYWNYELVAIIAIPMSFGIYILSKEIILIFAGKEYFEAIIVSKILATLIFIIPTGDILGSKILLLYKKEKELLTVSIITAVFNIVLNLILIPHYNIIGASIATLISYIIALVSRYYFVIKIMPFKLLNFNIIKYFLFSLMFIIYYKYLFHSQLKNLTEIIIYILICMCSYFWCLLISENELLKNFIKIKK